MSKVFKLKKGDLFMKKKKQEKRGVSPVIATVLLISMVVVLAMIVILWFTSLTTEAVTKFEEENIELVCQNKVEFSASYSSGVLAIVNTGSSPIYRMKVKEESAGGHSTEEISFAQGWPDKGLNPGGSFSLSESYSGDITLIPVLLGESESGLKTHVCDEKQGYELTI